VGVTEVDEVQEVVQVGDEQVAVYYYGMFDFVKYHYPYALQNYRFAGFDFRYHVCPLDVILKYGTKGRMEFGAILHNPEDNAFLSYHNVWNTWSKEMAAAWLIAHWWEHYMHTCQCQVDDNRPSRFRWAFIDTLLCLEGK